MYIKIETNILPPFSKAPSTTTSSSSSSVPLSNKDQYRAALQRPKTHVDAVTHHKRHPLPAPPVVQSPAGAATREHRRQAPAARLTQSHARLLLRRLCSGHPHTRIPAHTLPAYWHYQLCHTSE